MRGVWVAAIVCAAALAGCADGGDGGPRPVDVGHDPNDITVTGYRRDAFDVEAFDGLSLSAVAYVPQSPDLLPDGSGPTWPVVVFLHGVGLDKRQFEGTDGDVPGAPGGPGEPDDAGSQAPQESSNTLARFARQGVIAVAYDLRGHGKSGGVMTFAGSAEKADLEAVLNATATRYDTSGRTGVVGVSHGAGVALWALEALPQVDTAVVMSGWTDLYDAVWPGNVPKLAWGQALYAAVTASGRGPAHPVLTQWYLRSTTRDAVAQTQAQMAARSVQDGLEGVRKPMLVCQGLQDSLFQQSDRMWATHAGFLRAYVHEGGSSLLDPGCVSRSLDWSLFFLAGKDTGLATWPALQTEDAAGGPAVSYPVWPRTLGRAWYLRAPDLAASPSPDSIFTIEQELPAGLPAEPGVAGDLLGPSQAIPEALRSSPAAIRFASPALDGGATILGVPSVTLRLADANVTGWQVAAQLLVEAEGRSRIISRGAVAALDEGDLHDGMANITMSWTKVELEAGDRIVLQLLANDVAWFYPLLEDYQATFRGDSALHVPFVRT